MLLACKYNPKNGALLSVFKTTDSSNSIFKENVPHIQDSKGNFIKHTFGIIKKSPKEIADKNAVWIHRNCRIKDIFSDGTVEIEIIGKKKVY